MFLSCVYVCPTLTWLVLAKSQEGIRSPGTTVIHGCKLPCHSDAEDWTQILCKALLNHWAISPTDSNWCHVDIKLANTDLILQLLLMLLQTIREDRTHQAGVRLHTTSKKTAILMAPAQEISLSYMSHYPLHCSCPATVPMICTHFHRMRARTCTHTRARARPCSCTTSLWLSRPPCQAHHHYSTQKQPWSCYILPTTPSVAKIPSEGRI